FFANRHGWEVWLPTVPLDRLYGTELRRWYAARGVDLRLNAGVRSVAAVCDAPTSASGAEVILRSGERLAGDAVVLAVPQHLVPELAPALSDWWNDRDGPSRLESAPISSIHLWYDRPVTADRHVTFVGRTSQWLFNRGAIHDESPANSAAGLQPEADVPPEASRGVKADPWYGQVVISASHNVAGAAAQQTIDRVVAELAEVYPASRDARLLRSRLVTEHRAVLSVQPGVDRYRPGPNSPVPNLYLAGDWIQTGWPSTMEGAVRSGWLAAEAVLARHGSTERLLADDLPIAGLSKWLLGL
ncbi:MAG: squalene-associated FAD-dependent desaturase, partial [Planctomycetaceae bacterium]